MVPPAYAGGTDSLSHLFRRALDGFTNSHIGGAAAKIPTHRFFDVRIRWFRGLFQQSDRAHDLSALTIAALDHVFFDPRSLHCPSNRILAHAFDRSYLSIAN